MAGMGGKRTPRRCVTHRKPFCHLANQSTTASMAATAHKPKAIAVVRAAVSIRRESSSCRSVSDPLLGKRMTFHQAAAAANRTSALKNARMCTTRSIARQCAFWRSAARIRVADWLTPPRAGTFRMSLGLAAAPMSAMGRFRTLATGKEKGPEANPRPFQFSCLGRHGSESRDVGPVAFGAGRTALCESGNS